MKELSDLVHTTEGANWHPVSSPLADGESMWQIIENRDDDMDMWTVQLYRGQTFYDFWTKYQQASAKPMIITEFGVDSFVEGLPAAQGASC